MPNCYYCEALTCDLAGLEMTQDDCDGFVKRAEATPTPPVSPSNSSDLLVAEIAPLVEKLAQWERDNGTLACLFSREHKDEVCGIISAWALQHAMRRIDEGIKQLGN